MDAFLGQVALSVLLALLVVAALAGGLVTAVSLWRSLSARDGPKLLFVGWGRLGWVCLWSLVVPLGAYAVYFHACPFSPRRYGLTYAAYRVLVEGAFVATAVIVLAVEFGSRAVRQRAVEAGMVVPEAVPLSRRWAWLIAGILLLGLAGAYVAAWESGRLGPGSGRTGRVVSILLAAAGAAYLVARLMRGAASLAGMSGELVHFRRTLVRSVVPVLAALVIVAAMGMGTILVRQETAAVGRMTGAASCDFRNEIELSDYRLVRDRLAAASRPPADRPRPE